ncbi:MAG TPA: hypothetical protein VMD30_12135 [Tepidisphaeraceae bacterium]|nr:hypothetical protein [Tepidisphaeraceae bacterium]
MAVSEIQNGNAVAQFNSRGSLVGLVVNNTTEFASQDYWYHVGNTNTPNSLLESLPNTQNFGTDFLQADYTGSGFTVDITYLLTGGVGNSPASLSETLDITNTGQGPLSMHFLEFNAFGLDDSLTGNTASITGGNTANQTGPRGTTLTETVTPPNEYQTDSDAAIIDSLDGGNPTTLNNDGDLTPAGEPEFAFQWDPSINAGSSFLISKVATITPAVPLPPAAATGLFTLIGLGLFALVRRKLIA